MSKNRQNNDKNGGKPRKYRQKCPKAVKIPTKMSKTVKHIEITSRNIEKTSKKSGNFKKTIKM